MFAKVFGQIFDSSIAEDYNCRRMFMDLLVLADSTGAVDMTLEAISRRTNVPITEVSKYINELCQPDKLSRSKLHEGKRLIPLDVDREWGWQIVNYGHYRGLRDEEARRTYFRTAQRKYRAKQKTVKDKGLTSVDIPIDEYEYEEADEEAKAKTRVHGENWLTKDCLWIDLQRFLSKEETDKHTGLWLKRIKENPRALYEAISDFKDKRNKKPIRNVAAWITQRYVHFKNGDAEKRAKVRELSEALNNELKK